MLQSLHIVNFAIIEDTIIELTDGATVFTGETGAGKSILIDALAILLGRHARTGLFTPPGIKSSACAYSFSL